jgi:hypothetical protein
MMNLSPLRSLSVPARVMSRCISSSISTTPRASCLNTGLPRAESMGVIGGVWGMAPGQAQ